MSEGQALWDLEYCEERPVDAKTGLVQTEGTRLAFGEHKDFCPKYAPWIPHRYWKEDDLRPTGCMESKRRAGGGGYRHIL